MNVSDILTITFDFYIHHFHFFLSHFLLSVFIIFVGTILASSRGGFDLDIIINFLKKNKINQLYVIGGDGTHRYYIILSVLNILLSSHTPYQLNVFSVLSPAYRSH